MNGWNRLFVVIAVCWVLAAPFLVMADTNSPIERLLQFCGETAYQLYGSSGAALHGTRNHYTRDVVSLPNWCQAGGGDWKLGIVAWGFILFPPALIAERVLGHALQ